MSQNERRFLPNLTRRQWIILASGTVIAAALGIKASQQSERELTPVEAEFFKKTKALLRQNDLPQVPLRMDVSTNQDSPKSLEYGYRNNKLTSNLVLGFPDDDKSFVYNQEISKTYRLTDDEFINIPGEQLVYAFVIEEQKGISYISNVKIFDPGSGRGVLFTWSPNSSRNEIILEKEKVESSTVWPWHIDVHTIDYDIPTNISANPSTIWHPNTPPNEQQRSLSQLIDEWKNLIATDLGSRRSRFDMLKEFSQKTATIIKNNIITKTD